MGNSAKGNLKVSPDNPCPFLRGLVEQGTLSDDSETCSKVTDAIVEQAKKGEGKPSLSFIAIYVVSLISNGISPLSILKTIRKGVKLNKLRNGPLYKKGAGSGVLDHNGNVSEQELERLSQFASEKNSHDGSTELGLDATEIRAFMDANYERAVGQRRRINRIMMNGEWPVLLRVMGKDGPDGRYLSVDEVRDLVSERRFPSRMAD